MGTLTTLFVALLLPVAAAGGFVSIVSPGRGRVLLKRAAIALVLFMLGAMAVSSVVGGYLWK